MIPSGYKEDVVYSEIPINGAGDLAFTRASNGTRINSQGLVEVVPWNLFQQSENFPNAIWTKSTLTFNSTVTAPNGTSTAQNYSTAGAYSYVLQTITVSSGEYYTVSCYLKYTSGVGSISIGYTDAPSNNFIRVDANLINGTIGSVSYGGNGANGTATITSVGDGWYRVTVSGTLTIGNAGLIVSNLALGATTFSIWGAQLNIGSTAKPYFPTTDRLNVPRLTYQNGGGGCPSLLLEKQSTNYILQSQNFTTFWSFANLLYTANQAISPDGTQNATKLDNTTGTGQHRYFQLAFTGLTNETISFSIYAKQGTHRYISWGITDDSNYRGQVVVDLQTGTITDQFTASATLSNLSVVSQGNGWYRISGTVAVSANYAGGNAYGFGLMLNSASWSTASYTGTETYFYGWGAQAELSSYPTTYIPTTSSSATRVADACFKTGISSLIGQTEGVIFYDGVLTGISNLYANLINSEKNITGSFSIGQRISTGAILCGFFVGGSQIINFDTGTYALGTRTKIAFAYKSGNFALYVNGTQLATSSATFTPVENIDDIIIGDETTYFNYKENTQVNQVALFKTRLTNAELQALTTL
jgi:hypothetical protein